MFRDHQAFSSFSVDDVEAARRFYGEALGLDVALNQMGYLDLTLSGGARIMVYPKPNHQPATFTVLNFLVPDIDQAVDGLVAAGVKMEQYNMAQAPQDEKGIARDDSGGPQIAWFLDPAGNTIAVLQA
jgi:catechol 2,3-dioxygenase-like lactoylglutathione lyase family enzyme